MQGTELCTSVHHGGSHLGRAVLAHQPPFLFTPVVSAEFMVSVEKTTGESHDFRWRCLDTSKISRLFGIWKRLLAEKPYIPPIPVCPFDAAPVLKMLPRMLKSSLGLNLSLGNFSMCLCFLQ